MPQATDRQRTAWFRPGPDLNMRVSDADRSEVADRLARHYSDGRLDQAEFDERVTRAMAAKTVGDLQGLFDDLPDLPGESRDGTPGDDTARGPQVSPVYGRTVRRRPRGVLRVALLAVLVLAAANIAGHLVLGWISPIAWLVVIAAIVVAVSRHHHHDHHHHDHQDRGACD
jgi:hypothetical protein